MNKKLKIGLVATISSIVIFSAAAVPLSLKQTSSYNQTSIDFKQENLTPSKKELKELEWEKFLNNEGIDNVLKIVYPDEVERKEYINIQKSIDDASYLRNLKNWNNYSNTINKLPQDKFLTQDAYPYPYRMSKEHLKILFERDWLWFLFNITKFDFILFTENSGVSNNVENSRDFNKVISKNALNNLFYRPTSNEITQYTTWIEDEDPKNYQMSFHFMNKEGFWLTLLFYRGYDERKQEFKNPVIAIDKKFTTLPNLIKDRANIHKTFDLKKYIDVKKGSEKSVYASFFASQYREEFGGDEVIYKIIDNDLE